MRATGIIRRIDDLGRILIPKEIRRMCGIGEGTPMEIFTDSNGIVLKKYNVEGELLNTVTTLSEAVYSSRDDLEHEKFCQINKCMGQIKELLK